MAREHLRVVVDGQQRRPDRGLSLLHSACTPPYGSYVGGREGVDTFLSPKWPGIVLPVRGGSRGIMPALTRNAEQEPGG